MKNLTPIVLFTYNRLWHTQQTIESLAKNELASESELFIYSDGWKNEDDKSKVLEVRKYLKTIDCFKKITIIEQKENLGLADSIISGVSKIVNEYGKIIVLEDDIVTSPYFLKYMNDALDFYENKDNIWHISGWNYPIVNNTKDDVFLWQVMNCWGWATWSKKWKFYEKNSTKLINEFSEEDIYRFNFDGTCDFWSQVLSNEMNNSNTWAIFWYATIFKHSGLCLNPIQTFVDNIGFDDQSTHCNTKNYIDDVNTNTKISLVVNSITNNINITKIKDYFMKDKNIKRFSDSDHKKLRETPRSQEVSFDFLNTPMKAPDAASLLFLNLELFELEIYKFSSSNDRPLIIDCGANIGLSVIYFKKLYPNAKVIAFEPDKKIFDYLKFNINSFNFNEVTLLNKGLWEEETTLSFYSEGADGGRVANESDKDNIITIETVKLSSYIKDVNIDFLKIDIEGAECDVLEECSPYLKTVKNIFVEYHSFVDKPQTLSKILSILEKSGFRYYIEHTGVKSKHPFESISNYVGFDNQLNIFGYRNEIS